MKRTKFSISTLISVIVAAALAGGALAAEKSATTRPAERSAEQKVLDKHVGNWLGTPIVHKAKWTPREIRGTGVRSCVRILGGRFTVNKSVGSDGSSSLRLTTYDTQRKCYRMWYFDSRGTVVESQGQWDDETKTSTWLSDNGNGVTFVSKAQYLDDNTVKWSSVTKDATGEIVFHAEGKERRVKQLPKRNPTTRPTSRPTYKPISRPAWRPIREKALDVFPGDWKTTTTIPDGVSLTGKSSIVRILDGRFIQESNRASDGKAYLRLMTYDVQRKCYRMWYFDLRGGMGEFKGKFDARTRTLTMINNQDNGVTNTTRIRVVDKYTFKLNSVTRDLDGKVVRQSKGKQTKVGKDYAPRLLGEKEIMKLDGNVARDRNRGGYLMRLSPDGRRVLYLRKETFHIAAPNGLKRNVQGCRIVLRDLKTGKDTAPPVPAMSEDFVSGWMMITMTMFDPTGKTLVVPAGRDADINYLMETPEGCGVGLYDIESGKLKTLDFKDVPALATFHPDGKKLIVMTFGRVGPARKMELYVTPTGRIELRKLSKTGMICGISPTSDLMVMQLIPQGRNAIPDKFVLYDPTIDRVKAELGGRKEITKLRDNYPQWTADGRYLYYVTRKYEMREGLRRAILTTRIWDTKAGKVAGLIEGDTTGVFPFGAGPGKGTMLLTRPTLIRVHNRSYLRLAVTRPAFLHPRNKGHLQSVPQVVLHARDNKMLGDELHPLGDTSMRPIGVQGKWLLFIREDANGILNKVCIAEIMLPKKQPAR